MELRSDLENDNIFDTTLVADGKTLSNPDNYTIACYIGNDWVTDYHYDSKTEYENDVKLLGL